MSRTEQAEKIIAPYIGKTVTAERDGTLFEHVRATFAFRFVQPAALAETLADEYGDYLSEWDLEETVPVASVSKAGQTYAFAWLFLDWSHGAEQPRVLVTTTDRWEIADKYTLPDLAALGFTVA